MIHLRENVGRGLMNSVEIRNEKVMARRQRLFLQDLTETQDVTQWIPQIMARFADASAEESASAGCRRRRATRLAGLGGIGRFLHERSQFKRAGIVLNPGARPFFQRDARNRSAWFRKRHNRLRPPFPGRLAWHGRSKR